MARFQKKERRTRKAEETKALAAQKSVAKNGVTTPSSETESIILEGSGALGTLSMSGRSLDHSTCPTNLPATRLQRRTESHTLANVDAGPYSVV